MGGNATSSATLTIVIQLGAVSVGTYDNLNKIFWTGKITPQTFLGDTILLSTGINRADFNLSMGNGMNTCNFAHNVTITHADPSRPGGISYFNFGSCTNMTVYGISFTGDLGNINGANYINVVQFAGCSNVNIIKCNMTFNPQTCEQGGAVIFSGCINCAAIDVYAFGVNSGVADNQEDNNVNILVSRFRLRQFYNNAFFIGNSDGMTIIDCKKIS